MVRLDNLFFAGNRLREYMVRCASMSACDRSQNQNMVYCCPIMDAPRKGHQ